MPSREKLWTWRVWGDLSGDIKLLFPFVVGAPFVPLAPLVPFVTTWSLGDGISTVNLLSLALEKVRPPSVADVGEGSGDEVDIEPGEDGIHAKGSSKLGHKLRKSCCNVTYCIEKDVKSRQVRV